VSRTPGQTGGGVSTALMATAERVRRQAQLPPQKDVLAAAGLVLATAMTAMMRLAAAVEPPATGAAAALRERVVAACVLQICARHLSAALAGDGWPVPLDSLVAFAGTVVFADLTAEEQARLVASGAATLEALRASPHPRASEIKAQIETCFDAYVRSGESEPLAALAELYGALRRAGEP